MKKSDFLFKLLSEDGSISSKRWMGMNILYFIMIVFVLTIILYGFSDWHQSFIERMFYGALALMGLTALDKIVSIFKK